jgi:hypothetical protein
MKKRKTVVKVTSVMQGEETRTTTEIRPSVGTKRPSNYSAQQMPGRPDLINPLYRPIAEHPPGSGSYSADTAYLQPNRNRRKNSDDAAYYNENVNTGYIMGRLRQGSAPDSSSEGIQAKYVNQRSRSVSNEAGTYLYQEYSDPRFVQRNRSSSNDHSGPSDDQRRKSSLDNNRELNSFPPNFDQNRRKTSLVSSTLVRIPSHYGSAPSNLDSTYNAQFKDYRINPSPRKDSLPEQGITDTLPYRDRSGSVDPVGRHQFADSNSDNRFVNRREVRPMSPNLNRKPDENARFHLEPQDLRTGYIIRPFSTTQGQPVGPSFGTPTQRNNGYLGDRRPSQDRVTNNPPFTGRRSSNDEGRSIRPKTPVPELRSKNPINNGMPQRSKTPTAMSRSNDGRIENRDTTRDGTSSRENARRGADGLNNLLQNVLAECEDYIDKLDTERK